MQKKWRPEQLLITRKGYGLIHSAALCRHCRICSSVRSRIRLIGDKGFRGENHRRNGRSVLDRRTGYLRRIKDTGFEHIDILLGRKVEAIARLIGFLNLIDDHRALQAGVCSNLAHRLFQRFQHNLHAGFLIGVIRRKKLLNCGDRVDQRNTAAGYNAFFHSSLGRSKRILDAELLLLHLGFSSGANMDDRNATGELCKALLQLLTVKIGRGLFDLNLDLVDADS